MKAEAVGCVVATSDGEDAIGVVTDRDLVTRVVAPGGDPDATPVSAIMSAPPVTAESTQPLEEVVAKMRAHGVRRVPIVSDGRATGRLRHPVVTGRSKGEDLPEAIGLETGRQAGIQV